MSSYWRVISMADNLSYQVTWDKFDDKTYINKKRVRPGDDPYARNKFNQQASDNVPTNRKVPDTRHMK